MTKERNHFLENFTDMDDTTRKTFEKHKIEIRKQIANLKKGKPDNEKKCYFCKKSNIRYCNSHTIPASILRNIAIDGNILTNNSLVNIPIMDIESGVNNTGTFKLLCRDCDSSIFSDYENNIDSDEIPSQKQLGQIALKHCLRNIYKKYEELRLLENFEKNRITPLMIKKQIEVFKMDLREHERNYKKAYKTIIKDNENRYLLLFHKVLEYSTKIAFQNQTALFTGFGNKIINNRYNYNKNYQIQPIHICVFPINNKTYIYMFIDREHTRYREFNKTFSRLEEEDQLSVINFILLSLSEEIFISPVIKDLVENDDCLKEIAGMTGVRIENANSNPYDFDRSDFSLDRREEITNLLLDIEI